MRKYIMDFCAEFEFPEGAGDSLAAAWDKISAVDAAESVFDKHVAAYEAGEKLNHPAMLAQVREAAAAAGVHRFTAELLIYVILAKHLRVKYREAGLPDDMYKGVPLDLKYKFIECRKVHGIDGAFVAFWFDRFFDMTRFTLGRLQFEMDVCRDKGEVCGIKIGEGEGTAAISVHIPSSGPLYYDAVIDSYHRAAEFFADKFPDGTVIFMCHSWLMYRPMLDFLPETSRVRPFISDYCLIHQVEDPAFIDCWRLFDMPYSGDPSLLPRDASIRRAYAEYLDGGGVPGYGMGIMIMKNGEIITHAE